MELDVGDEFFQDRHLVALRLDRLVEHAGGEVLLTQQLGVGLTRDRAAHEVLRQRVVLGLLVQVPVVFLEALAERTGIGGHVGSPAD